MAKRIYKSASQGIRYFEHETRKIGIRKDRYYSIRHTVDGKQIEEGLGWTSQGWTVKKAQSLLGILNENKRRGEGPRTLKEKRELEARKKRKEQEEKIKKLKDSLSFKDLFEGKYTETVKGNKHLRSWQREESLFKRYLEPAIGKKPLSSITPFDLEKIKRTMKKKGLAPRSIAYALAVIRQVFNFAICHNLFDGNNPVSKIKLPSSDNRRMRLEVAPIVRTVWRHK